MLGGLVPVLVMNPHSKPEGDEQHILLRPQILHQSQRLPHTLQT